MTDAHTPGPGEARRAALLDACIKLRDEYGTNDLDEVIEGLKATSTEQGERG